MHYCDVANELSAQRARQGRQFHRLNATQDVVHHEIRTVAGRKAYLEAMEEAASEQDVDLRAVCDDLGHDEVLKVLRLAASEDMTPEQALKYLLEEASCVVG